MLTLLQGSIARRGSFSKGSGKIEGRDILSSLMLQLLENWEGDLAHRGPRGFRSNTDFGKICIQLLNFVLKAGLSHPVPLKKWKEAARRIYPRVNWQP